MSYLDRIRACNAGDLSRYRPLIVAGHDVGRIAPEIANRLADFPTIFNVGVDVVELNPALATVEDRTAAVAVVSRKFYEQGIFTEWWDEQYPIATSFGAPLLLTVERGCVPCYGFIAYGVHINGIVRDGGETRMWIARRSRGKRSHPGLLDQIVAGGQPAGLTLVENVIKECAEEAAIPAGLARCAQSVGTITYTGERLEGLRNDVLFNYDLELPADFTPFAADGEVEKFYLWSLAEVAERVCETEDFKFNCNLVIIDFLIRHGFIPADHPDYVAISRGLHA
jgi:8-oxo-dGTP pyrophosphatase MutT (NUDIX family)